ncbi:MAG TPA: DJ-1/PfpI family protein, partial [Spirochaetales bacterium]|nr:DJ-1/PfpI family protein [Spirochaetales bacterium]
VETLAAGIGGRDIVGAHGIAMAADAVLDDIDNEDFDCVVIPGGLGGAQAIAADADALAFIQRMYNEGALVAALCAAPALVLGSACSLLDAKRFTCYPGMEGHVPEGKYSTDRVVLDGNLLTAQGPGCSGEFALAAVRYLRGSTEADKLAKSLIMA